MDLERLFCSDCVYAKRVGSKEPNRKCTYPPYAKKMENKLFYAGWPMTAVLQSAGLGEEIVLMQHYPNRLCYSEKENDPFKISGHLNLIWGYPDISFYQRKAERKRKNESA